MAKITVYLPDDLAERVKASDLNVSQLTQRALREALDRSRMTNWLDSLGLDRPAWGPSEDAQDALRELREEHG